MANPDELQQEADELGRQLADPAVMANPQELVRLAKRQKVVLEQLEVLGLIAGAEAKIRESEKLAAGGDAELAELASSELTEQQTVLAEAKQKLAELSREVDERDGKNVIMEIRAGAGGDEASLFARELFGAYQKYADGKGWQVELMSSSQSEAGGYKELIVRVDGDGAFGELKYEGGTHRVQRIPVTESGGRIHTSTVTVAVLPEAEESELKVKPEEIRVDVFRSSGPGGQSVNTTDSAVRITHLPTGLTVSCQDEKSQHKNRAKAMTILRSRLQAAQQEAAAQERGSERRSQIGTGDRSEKIRTYNFPQDRLTDHRIKFSTHGLDKIMAGDLGPVINALHDADDHA